MINKKFNFHVLGIRPPPSKDDSYQGIWHDLINHINPVDMDEFKGSNWFLRIYLLVKVSKSWEGLSKNRLDSDLFHIQHDNPRSRMFMVQVASVDPLFYIAHDYLVCFYVYVYD